MSHAPSRDPGGQGPRPRPPRRRGPSRSVRLRRTIAAALGLVLVVVAAVALTRGWGADQPVQASSALPTTGATGHGSARASARPSGDASGRPHRPATARTNTSTKRASDPTPSPAKPSDVPARGTGHVHLARVPGPASSAAGTPVRYTVAVEGGLPVTGRAFARTVHDILLDPRGWQTKDHVRFVAVTPRAAERGAHVDIRVILASPDTTDRLCAPFHTAGKVSCTTTTDTVVLNLRRWMLGAATWGDDVRGYRRYLVNHEVGHGLGHHHVHCSGKGRRAPVMLQQSLRLEGCTPWSWPTGAKDGAPAPG